MCFFFDAIFKFFNDLLPYNTYLHCVIFSFSFFFFQSLGQGKKKNKVRSAPSRESWSGHALHPQNLAEFLQEVITEDINPR